MTDEKELDAHNDAVFHMSLLDSIKSYKEYIPDEVMVCEPESERFEDAVRKAERSLGMMDPDDLREWQEHERKN